MRAWLLLCLAPCWLLGCADDDGADPGEEAAGAGGADDGLGDCPDPRHPQVYYVTRDVNECPIESLMCDADQNGFHNACGCGCIDKGYAPCTLDPSTTFYISEDPAECVGVTPACELGERPFNNSCGCGCVVE
jgi:hypothetical protein